jgi:hypothetical protein
LGIDADEVADGIALFFVKYRTFVSATQEPSVLHTYHGLAGHIRAAAAAPGFARVKAELTAPTETVEPAGRVAQRIPG